MKGSQLDYIRLAVPKGRFLAPTAALIEKAGLGFSGYHEKTRRYRFWSESLPQLSAKLLQEKDIPIQVAVGNYDLGICGSDWFEEFAVRYPAGALAKVSSLGHAQGNIYVVGSNRAGITSLDEWCTRGNDCRIVTEYPNLAEAFALSVRMRRFRIFPVWGATEVYPPESADLAVLWGRSQEDIESQGLICLKRLFPVTLLLVANRESLQHKDLSPILRAILSQSPGATHREDSLSGPVSGYYYEQTAPPYWGAKIVKLALPDGHQQEPTAHFLKQAGIVIEGYSPRALSRRPLASLDWLGIKVIRPQDMPVQVANGNFDLAITGEDWLLEQLYRFPSMPVKELFPLGFGIVRVVAAVSEDLPVTNIDELRSLVEKGDFAPLRVASEYINVADKYLRDNRINPYKLIPTWGASEAFLPEDADMLVDNTQTGATLKEQRLRIVDVLFQSSACLIANERSLEIPEKRDRMNFLIEKLYAGLS